MLHIGYSQHVILMLLRRFFRRPRISQKHQWLPVRAVGTFSVPLFPRSAYTPATFCSFHNIRTRDINFGGSHRLYSSLIVRSTKQTSDMPTDGDGGRFVSSGTEAPTISDSKTKSAARKNTGQQAEWELPSHLVLSSDHPDMIAITSQLGLLEGKRRRIPNNIMSVVAREEGSGLPAVCKAYPLRSGLDAYKKKQRVVVEPFPTLYWLCSPNLSAKVSALEKQGFIKRFEGRLNRSANKHTSSSCVASSGSGSAASSPSVSCSLASLAPHSCKHSLPAHHLAFIQAHRDYARERWSVMTPRDQALAKARGWESALRRVGIAGTRFEKWIFMLSNEKSIESVYGKEAGGENREERNQDDRGGMKNEVKVAKGGVKEASGGRKGSIEGSKTREGMGKAEKVVDGGGGRKARNQKCSKGAKAEKGGAPKPNKNKMEDRGLHIKCLHAHYAHFLVRIWFLLPDAWYSLLLNCFNRLTSTSLHLLTHLPLLFRQKRRMELVQLSENGFTRSYKRRKNNNHFQKEVQYQSSCNSFNVSPLAHESSLMPFGWFRLAHQKPECGRMWQKLVEWPAHQTLPEDTDCRFSPRSELKEPIEASGI